jgi:Carboxypeptidase regulatory-like domain
MNTRFAARKIVVSVLVCLGLAVLCATMAHAQSGGTGAITGTLTDPQGRAVPGAAVSATSLATNQERTATTGGDGEYKFSLLSPGAYRLKFTAAGFKTTEVSGVAVNTTETTTVDKVLEVGTVNQTVTVESSVETLQTESSTLGTTVTGNNIAALPMANGNYTEVLSLTAGTSSSVDNATVLGKGTQDISANGVDPGSNNFQMDGVAVNNIANSGSSNDGTIYTGIPIPSPDAIAEFKIQTSTYDASYGRNPGANVNVSTKSGSNEFHGSAFEFFRNTVLNANDFFLKATSAENVRPAFDQNQFGATIGGPVKKDKIFFFFSYRGTRSKNGEAPQAQTFGALLGGINTESRGTCPAPLAVPDFSSITTCDAAAQKFAADMNVQNIVALRIFQIQGGVKTTDGSPNYYIPNPASVSNFCDGTSGVCNFDIPAIYTENQYVANSDWVINSKETLSTKYFYTHNPYVTFLGQAGGNLDGTPENILFGNHAAVLKLTSLVTNNFVNEARVSFQQNVNAATISMPPGGTPQELGMQPLVQGFFEPPSFLNIATGYGMFGGLLPDKGPTNQLQAADQISWSHGRHSIRAGYEFEWTNWPLSDQGLQQGLMVVTGYGSLQGAAPTLGGWNFGCLFCVKSTSGTGQGIIHFYQLHNQDSYVLDDWKVSSRLTINMGLRWEYDGLLSDKYGHLTQVWEDRMVANASVPTCLGAFPDPCGPGGVPALPSNSAGIQQYVVPSNFIAHFGNPPAGVGIARNRNSVEGHAPYSDFAPRLGFAWQPLGGGKLVVRGGVGIFYDRVGLDRVVHAFEQGYPYAATYDFGFLSPRWAQSTLQQPYPQIQLVCMPSDPNCNNEPNGLGFAARWADPTTGLTSGLNTPLDPNSVHVPLVREYSLGFQYEFLHGWVLDMGYVGSSGINLTDYNHNHNGAQIVTPGDAADQLYHLCTGVAPNQICNTTGNTAFRVPVVGYEPIGLQSSDNNGYSNYNSLQVTVRHQFSHGLTFQSAYTWDKNLSDIFYANTGDINDALALRSPAGLNGPRTGQYGRVSFDRQQRLAINYSYDLPFGSGTSGIEEKLIKGWNVSGVTIAQSGDPLTFIDPGIPGVSPGTGAAYGTSTGLSFQGVSTAEFCGGMGDGNIKNPGGTRANLHQYFNPAAFNSVGCQAPLVPFGGPGATDYGNSGIGIVTGPGQFNWDITIMKNTQITERIRMQFRSDFYNAFNHPQFADPGAGGFGTIGFENITAPTYGVINHLSVNPRLIQFGLHFFF